MRNKLPLVLQIVGIMLFLSGSFFSKNGNLLGFLISLGTGQVIK